MIVLSLLSFLTRLIDYFCFLVGKFSHRVPLTLHRSGYIRTFIVAGPGLK